MRDRGGAYPAGGGRFPRAPVAPQKEVSLANAYKRFIGFAKREIAEEVGSVEEVGGEVCEALRSMRQRPEGVGYRSG